jgi:hypothetical protein
MFMEECPWEDTARKQPSTRQEEKKPNFLTPYLGFVGSKTQDNEKINSCCQRHSGYGILLF